MTVVDLAKATLVCGGGSFLIYSYPVLGQILVIAVLSLFWLAYARSVLGRLRRR
jgi:hypothetical protein